MTTRPLYPQGRASAPSSAMGCYPDGRAGRPDYDLIVRLRAVRALGDEAMTAAEEYDPNFALKLSACFIKDDADRLLDEWLSHRVAVLRRTQAEFRRVRENARRPIEDRASETRPDRGRIG
jgi:hypothetical protein